MGCLYPEALPVLHFNSFVAPAVPGSDESTYSSTEKQLVAARHAFGTTGNGYFMLQSTKVCMNGSLVDVDNVFLTDKETHSRLPLGLLSLLLHFQSSHILPRRCIYGLILLVSVKRTSLISQRYIGSASHFRHPLLSITRFAVSRDREWRMLKNMSRAFRKGQRHSPMQKTIYQEERWDTLLL